MGTAPMPPVAKNDLRAIGRTNDCILYGGQARYTVRAGDAELAELAAKVPASASRDYGTPFYEIFQRYEGDFYKIDPLLFSPAEVWLTSTETRPDVSRGAPQSRGAGRVLLPELIGPLHPRPRSYRCDGSRAGGWSLPRSLAAACSKPADKAGRGAARRHRRRPPRPPRRPGPQAIVTVIYKPPKDTAAFEKYYRETHLPLVRPSSRRSGSPRRS